MVFCAVCTNRCTLLAVCLITALTTESYSSDSYVPVVFLLKFILVFVVVVNCYLPHSYSI